MRAMERLIYLNFGRLCENTKTPFRNLIGKYVSKCIDNIERNRQAYQNRLDSGMHLVKFLSLELSFIILL